MRRAACEGLCGMTEGPSLVAFLSAAVAFAIVAVAATTPWRLLGFRRRGRVPHGEAPRLAVAHASDEAARAWLARQRCACGRAAVADVDAQPIVVGPRLVTGATIACAKCARGRRVYWFVDETAQPSDPRGR